MSKNIIHEVLWNEYLDSCKLDSLLSILQNFKNKYPTDDIDIVYDGGYDGYHEMSIVLNRLETDKEYEDRMRLEKERLEEKEQKEMVRLLKCKTLNASNKEKLIKYIEKYK